MANTHLSWDVGSGTSSATTTVSATDYESFFYTPYIPLTISSSATGSGTISVNYEAGHYIWHTVDHFKEHEELFKI